jgi:glutaredoxin-like protein
MSEAKITVYGTNWCGDCIRTKLFFKRNNIDYKWVNIDHDKDAEKFVKETNKGFRSVPTIIFPDGSILVEPSTSMLAKKLDIK